ncbi:MAG: Fic family protein [Actinomycetota bacterium]
MPELAERIWKPDATYGYSRRDSQPFRYHAFIPDPIARLDPALPASVAATIEGAATAAVELDGSPGIEDLEPIARLLLRAESVASSRIEGLRISHRRLEEALLAPQAARGAALDVVRNIQAMERAIEIGTRPGRLDVRDLCDIHATLLSLQRDKHIAGRVRTEQNWIGGGITPRLAQFIPPPPEDVPDLLEDLITFSNRVDLSVVTQAAIAHVQFETIHPFADGNGRVGRCLVHVILRRRGLSRRIVPPISVVLAANADRYVKGLTSYRSGDLAEWCAVFSEATQVAADRAAELSSKLLDLESEWLERAGRPRRGSTARRVVEDLSAQPLLSVASASQLLGVSEEAARLALNQLAERGVLRQITVGRRNRAWAADDVFDLLDEFDLGMASLGEGRARPAPTRHQRSRGS